MARQFNLFGLPMQSESWRLNQDLVSHPSLVLPESSVDPLNVQCGHRCCHQVVIPEWKFEKVPKFFTAPCPSRCCRAIGHEMVSSIGGAPHECVQCQLARVPVGEAADGATFTDLLCRQPVAEQIMIIRLNNWRMATAANFQKEEAQRAAMTLVQESEETLPLKAEGRDAEDAALAAVEILPSAAKGSNDEEELTQEQIAKIERNRAKSLAKKHALEEGQAPAAWPKAEVRKVRPNGAAYMTALFLQQGRLDAQVDAQHGRVRDARTGSTTRSDEGGGKVSPGAHGLSRASAS